MLVPLVLLPRAAVFPRVLVEPLRAVVLREVPVRPVVRDPPLAVRPADALRLAALVARVVPRVVARVPAFALVEPRELVRVPVLRLLAVLVVRLPVAALAARVTSRATVEAARACG
jgi:hypothetical protein